MTVGTRATAADVAAATPPERDRFLDLLRVASIVVVVLGHYTIAAVERHGGGLRGANALGTSGWLRAATWLFQVMPVFFFVAGFGNAQTLTRRPASTAEYLRRRLDRVLVPAIAFTAVWVTLTLVLEWAAVDHGTVREAAKIAAQPLWFLAVYLLVIAAAPLQLAMRRRHAWLGVVALPVLAALLDVARLTGVAGAVADVNYVVVFLFAQELGFWYADDRAHRFAPRHALAVAAASLGLLVILTTAGPYPVSMVGVPGEAMSNMSPPTVCVVVLTVAQVSLLMACRAPVARWLQRNRPWRVTVAANVVILTVFLWHLTAFVAASAVLAAAGVPLSKVGSARFWMLKPLWIVVALGFLAVLIALFAPVERRRLMAPSSANGRSRVPAIVAVVLGAVAFASLAATGYDDLLRVAGRRILGVQVSPVMGLVLLASAFLLSRAPRSPSSK